MTLKVFWSEKCKKVSNLTLNDSIWRATMSLLKFGGVNEIKCDDS